MPRDLPVPDAKGIYGFPVDLVTAHQQWQRELARDRHAIATELVAPATGQSFLIERRIPDATDSVTVAIEPHNDDFVLSAGGTLLAQARPLVVITAYSQSSDIHPLAPVRDRSVTAISELRTKENSEALSALSASHHTLGLDDAQKPYHIADNARIKELADAIKDTVSTVVPNGNYKLIAPAGVTRHPDHLAVHEAAIRLGCTTFWDDTAFYPTYAANVDDRHLFELRVGNNIATRIVDITTCVLDKLTLLYMYQSQMQPPAEMYRVIRYNWTVGSAANAAQNLSTAVFAERFFEITQAAAA